MISVSALEYHRLTSYEAPDRFGAREDPRMVHGFRPMVLHRKPPPFKSYPELHAEPVPPELDDLLFLTAGVVRVTAHRILGRLYFRAAGSAGNLSPIELYVLHNGRVLHYEPVSHQVTAISVAAEGPTTFVVTGVPWRTAWKYTERGFRHLYWDAGTMLSHLLAAAPESRLLLGFVDPEVSALVGADAVNEFPLAVVVLGDGEPPLVPQAGPPPGGFLGDRPREFPLITGAQRAGDLVASSDVEAWRAATPSPPTEVDICFGRDLGEVVRRRGSSREFDPSAVLPSQVLTEAMTAATAPLNADFTVAGESLVTHHVLVHAVEGVAPGAYVNSDSGLELVERRDDTRAIGRFLTLNQELGGAGAYTVFSAADLTAVTGALGDRGYRCAQLEAGVVEGRLHLAAYALGFGATGLTFFDNDVRRALGTDDWPLLATAVGRPSYRSRRGGEPGRPTELSGRY